MQISNDAFYYLYYGEEPLDDENMEEAQEIADMFPNGFVIEDNWENVDDTDLIEWPRRSKRRASRGVLRSSGTRSCFRRRSPLSMFATARADGSVSVRSLASTRIRSWSGSRTRRQRKRSGSTSTPAPTSTATGRSMPRPSTRPMPGPSRTSRMTRLTAARGGVTKARYTPVARMRPGENWTRPPCWFAARRWAITASALWQITTFGVCKGGAPPWLNLQRKPH